MGFRDEIQAFIVAISCPGEAKKNKKGFERIIKKYESNAGHCMFCGQMYNTRIETLKEIETKLDSINGESGTKEQYCIFCGSTEYNGAEGIIHNDNCIIKKIRNQIKNE